MKTKLDHIVYAVPNLEKAIDAIEQRFGIRPVYGGRHELQGTHNALLSLGPRQYFEIIAPDPNSSVPPPRWMAVDLIQQATITRWAVPTTVISDKAAILQQYIPLLGILEPGSRRLNDDALLEWTLTKPLPGPEIDIIPFFIDWKDSKHPASHLPAICKLVNFKASHPDPLRIKKILAQLEVDLPVEKGDSIALIATIDTPNGQHQIQ